MLVRMTTERTVAIATPQQRQAIRRNQTQRLRDLGEQLLRAVEDLDLPKTQKDAEQAGKTLLVLDNLFDALYKTRPDDERIAPASISPPGPEVELEALTSWQAVLDASLAALAQARAARRET